MSLAQETTTTALSLHHPCPAEVELGKNEKLWPIYLAATCSPGAARFTPESERDKYRRIRCSLMKQELKSRSNETYFLENRAECEIMLEAAGSGDRSITDVLSLTQFYEVAREIQHWRDVDEQARKDAAGESDPPSAKQDIRATSLLFRDGTTRGIQVHTNLKPHRRYYGHSGGDFIFRLVEEKSPLDFLENDAFDARGNPIWPPPVSFEEQLRDESCVSCLNYCGQVPRSPKEYFMRLEVVYDRIIKLIASILLFDGQVGPLESESCKSCFLHELLTSSPSARDLDGLYHMWDEHYPDGSQPPCPEPPALVLELSFLLALFKNAVARSMAPLLLVVQRATGLGIPFMAHKYRQNMHKEGLRELRSGNLSHVFVFE